MVMYDTKASCIELQGRFKGTPLHAACGYGHEQVVQQLLLWESNVMESVYVHLVITL